MFWLPIYREREQHAKGREAADKCMGSGRAGYGRRKVLTPLSPDWQSSTSTRGYNGRPRRAWMRRIPRGSGVFFLDVQVLITACSSLPVFAICRRKRTASCRLQGKCYTSSSVRTPPRLVLFFSRAKVFEGRVGCRKRRGRGREYLCLNKKLVTVHSLQS